MLYSHGVTIVPTKYKKQQSHSPGRDRVLVTADDATSWHVESELSTNRRRSHVLSGRVDDCDTENITAVVIGKACIKTDKVRSSQITHVNVGIWNYLLLYWKFPMVQYNTQ